MIGPNFNKMVSAINDVESANNPDYKSLLNSHKSIVDIFRKVKDSAEILDYNTHISFMSNYIVSQIEAQLIRCINNDKIVDIRENKLINQILNLSVTIIDDIIAGNNTIDSRALLYHNIMTLLIVCKCDLSKIESKNLISFIHYFCDSFIE